MRDDRVHVHLTSRTAPVGYPELAAWFPDMDVRDGRLRGPGVIQPQLQRELRGRRAVLCGGKVSAGAINRGD